MRPGNTGKGSAIPVFTDTVPAQPQPTDPFSPPWNRQGRRKGFLVETIFFILVGVIGLFIVGRLVLLGLHHWQVYRDDRRDSTLGGSLLNESLMPLFEASRQHQADLAKLPGATVTDTNQPH